MADLWSFTTGQKGINRVTVYERVPGGPIHVQWWDRDGRHRETLRKAAGATIVNKDLAKAIAEAMSAGQRKAREAQAASDLLGKPRPRALSELFDALHKTREPEWSDEHKGDQARFRRFWQASLGARTTLDAIGPARVEQVAQLAAQAKGWSPRTRQAYLRYIVDAFYFGRRQLKWITEAQDLSAVRMPKVKSESKAYAHDELMKTLAEAPNVDLRCGAVAEIAYSTQRRLSAIRTLHSSAYRVEGDVAILTFPKATDKARTKGEAVLGASARVLVEQLLECPAVRASGLLIPAGDLEDSSPDRKPVGIRTLTDWWHEAEARAGVESVRGRAYHGIKRRAVTDARRAMGGDIGAVSKQSGTLEVTLTNVYEQDDIEAKVELAERLEKQRRRA